MPEVFDIRNGVLRKYNGADTRVVIPDGVTEIGKTAFIQCGRLISVTIPDSVTQIGFAAFAKCVSLTSVTIPGSVTKISEGAFSYCDKLTSVIIPDSVADIGGTAFQNTPGVTVICHKNSYAHRYCVDNGIPYVFNSLEYEKAGRGIVITGYPGKDPDPKIERTYEGLPVVKIGDKAFSKCDFLREIMIPDGVMEIGNYAFFGDGSHKIENKSDY